MSMVQTRDSLGWGHVGPWDLNHGTGPLDNATYKISSTWAKGSEEEDF